MPHRVIHHLSESSTVDQLFDAIEKGTESDSSLSPDKQKERMGHYRWTANQVAKAIKVGRGALTVRQLANCEVIFKRYVNRRRISKSAKAILPSYRNSIIRDAKQLGLFAKQNKLEQEWRCAREAVKGVAACPSIVQYAIDRKLHMSEFSDAILEDWAREKLEETHNCRFVISRKSAFRGAIRRANLAIQFPLLRTEIAPTFRFNAKSLPSWLRHDIALMICKMRDEARIDLRRFPWSAAHGLVLRFQELFGYYYQNRRELPEVYSLEQLINELIIRRYVLFLSDDKDWKRESIRAAVNTIANALGSHPELCTVDFDWVKACVQEIPEDDDSDIDADFTGTEVLLDDLALIPGKIRKKMNASTASNPRVRAWLGVKEFLIFFLCTHPWPAQCLRTCRIKGPKPNLFMGPRPNNGSFAIFPALERALLKKPKLWFWQFDFSPTEVRLGRYTRGPLVSLLARKMQGYLAHRAVLLKGKPDPGTLFVNSAGRAFKCSEFAKLVGDICYGYQRERVSLSEFRHKYLFSWLTDYPGDEERVAAVLWILMDSVSATLARNNVDPSLLGASRAGHWIQRCRSAWTS